MKAALVALLATAAALGLAEWACRRAERRGLEAMRFSESDLYYYHDAGGRRRHMPGKTGRERLWNGRGAAEFRINALGLRGPELGPKRGPRVLFLGDSITLGGRLDEKDTFVNLVGEKARLEAVNGGVGDTGLQEQLALLDEVGPLVKPDLVVLCWYLNDGRPPVGFPEEAVYGHPAIRWFHEQGWLRRSRLAGLLYDALRQALVRRQIGLLEARSRRFQWVGPYAGKRWVREPAEFARLVEAARFDWGDAWNDASLAAAGRGVLAARERARSLGARFALAVMPEHAQVYAQFEDPVVAKPQRALAAFAARQGVPFLDLLPPLRRRQRETLFYDNCHFTPLGNRAVAEELARFLERVSPPRARGVRS